MSSVGGAVDEPMMAKALNKWVNIGVIKEEEGGAFVLLEVQEEGAAKPSTSRQGAIVASVVPSWINLLTTNQLWSRKRLR